MAIRIPFHAMALSMLLCLAGRTEGGVSTIDGDEECLWANKSLIVAKVVDTTKVRSKKFEGLRDYVLLDPKLTIAGSFDCAAIQELKAPIVLGPFGSHLLEPPPAGSLVVVHLELCNDGYFVPGFCARYMPEWLPAWEVWGFHDEALFKIVSTVGERRRDGDKKEKERQADCAMWLKSTYPKHAQHIRPPVDKSFENRSIVLARVKTIEPGDKGQTLVALRLIGTVAGRLDAALQGEIQVTIPAELAKGRKLPWRDAEMFVAVDQLDGKFVLPDEKLDYMPSGWAFCRLETSPDALCDKILANLRQRVTPAK